MSEMILYKLLGRIPNTTDAEIKEAIADLASSKDMATKADIAELKTEMANQETRLIEKMANQEARLTKQMYAVAGIIIAAVGLMIKFL